MAMLTMRPSDATNSPSMISQPRPSSGSDQPSDSDPDRSQTQVQGQAQAQIQGQSLPFMLAPAKKKSHARKQSEDHVKRPRFVHPLPQSLRTVLMTKKIEMPSFSSARIRIRPARSRPRSRKIIDISAGLSRTCGAVYLPLRKSSLPKIFSI